MVKSRVVETEEGIQGEFDVQLYDQMVRRMRDKGWLETKGILNAGIVQGLALEVGPGPGYLGLEWLKNTQKNQSQRFGDKSGDDIDCGTECSGIWSGA